MATQGHGEHPAATSRRRTLGKEFTTTTLPVNFSDARPNVRESAELAKFRAAPAPSQPAWYDRTLCPPIV